MVLLQNEGQKVIPAKIQHKSMCIYLLNSFHPVAKIQEGLSLVFPNTMVEEEGWPCPPEHPHPAPHLRLESGLGTWEPTASLSPFAT